MIICMRYSIGSPTKKKVICVPKVKDKRLHFAWIVLLGACIFMGLARGGINNTGGLFMVPVMTDIGCGAGEFMLYYSVSSIVTFLFLPIAGKLMTKHDIRLLLVAGLIFQAGSFASFGLMNSICGWYVMAVPLSIGSVFTTQIGGPVLIGNWFRKYNGFAVGIMMASSSLIGAILQPFASNLITGFGWRYAYMIVGAVIMAIGIPVILFTIRISPEQKGLQPLGAGEYVNSMENDPEVLSGVTAKTAYKSISFWLLIVFVFLMTAVASFSQHIPSYAAQLGYDTNFAGAAMSFFMIGSLSGSLLFGLLNDRIGAQVTTIFALICGVVAMMLAIFLGNHPLFFNGATAILGFSSAAVGTMAPLLTTSIFGQKEYSKIYSVIAMGMAFAGIVAMPGYGFIYDAVKSYVPALWMIIVLLFICAGCIIAAFSAKKRMERKSKFKEK